jgi:hypothetical protein
MAIVTGSSTDPFGIDTTVPGRRGCFFTGLELVAPGLEQVPYWRAWACGCRQGVVFRHVTALMPGICSVALLAKPPRSPYAGSGHSL